jgi:Dolichyl-phosphate-mannose-protein mannosyltransferase
MDATATARSPLARAWIRVTEPLWALVAACFQPVVVAGRYGRTDYIILGLIAAAGAWLRFCSLGNVGLHGDEDLMALAARGLIEHGVPVLPSGMIYGRVPLHVHLVAASMQIFGEGEWALRLPSAIIGTLCIVFSFFVGKRFLEPKSNLMFVALIAFMPVMIEVSMTGRMYVFLVAGVLLFGALSLRWETSGSPGWLALAMIAMVLSLQFQALAIFAAPIFLYPGLSNRSGKMLLQGFGAMSLAVVAMEATQWWHHRYYPEGMERLASPPDLESSPLQILASGHTGLLTAGALLAACVVVVILVVARGQRMALSPATMLLTCGVTACVMLHYHVGLVALLVGSIIWLRTGEDRASRLWFVAAVVAAIAATQVIVLRASGEYPGRQLIGAMVGTPSIWPYFRFASMAPVAAVVLCVSVAVALVRMTKGAVLPAYFLFFVIAVWSALFALGAFTWDIAPRYTLGILPYFLLCVVAGLAYLVRTTSLGESLQTARALRVVVWITAVVVLVNPVAVLQVARNDYSDHPDHKGAAEYIKGSRPGPQDILIAEDSIVQTYYLGRVDYRLLNVDVARKHSVVKEGVLRGQYTGTPILGTGREFSVVLDAATTGEVYVIGSGENFADERRRNRGNGIAEVLESGRLEVVFEGRDGKTRVWRLRRN